jgi:hypothetical protein
VLHIPPWDQDRLTVRQWEQAVKYIDDMNAKAEQAGQA